MALTIQEYTLLVIVGTLLGLVYSFRYLISMERKIARMNENIEKITKKIFSEEIKIKKVEKKIAKKVGAIRKIRSKRRKIKR